MDSQCLIVELGVLVPFGLTASGWLKECRLREISL